MCDSEIGVDGCGRKIDTAASDKHLVVFFVFRCVKGSVEVYHEFSDEEGVVIAKLGHRLEQIGFLQQNENVVEFMSVECDFSFNIDCSLGHGVPFEDAFGKMKRNIV